MEGRSSVGDETVPYAVYSGRAPDGMGPRVTRPPLINGGGCGPSDEGPETGVHCCWYMNGHLSCATESSSELGIVLLGIATGLLRRPKSPELLNGREPEGLGRGSARAREPS